MATISSSVKPDATASHSVKSVTETLTALMAVTKPTAVRSIHIDRAYMLIAFSNLIFILFLPVKMISEIS